MSADEDAHTRMLKGYRTIAHGGEYEIEIKRSRFIGALARVTSEEEARAFIGAKKKENWEANHNCSAYIVGDRGQFQRSSDDGEPSGTAGVPMLSVLQRNGLTDVVAVVTRYFGGTLLGAGGLIRAYGQSVSETLAIVGIVEAQPRLIVAIEATYDDAGRLENALRATDFLLQDVEYGATVVFTLQTRAEELPALQAWVAEATNGSCEVIEVGEEYVEVPIDPKEETP
ncbi:MAG: YigZ family protein [Thermomicrobiales bacterium]